MADAYVIAKERPYAGQTAAQPARGAFAVTPDDNKDLTNATVTDPCPIYPKALYIGVTGDVAVITVEDNSTAAGTARVFKAHPVGYMPVQVRRVMSTGTTATNILALCD